MRENTENTLHILIHEIKNPLTIIKGYSELIKDADEQEKKEYADIISSETDYASFLLNNISTLNKLEENIPIVLCREELNIREITDIIINIYRKRFPNIVWINNIPENTVLFTDRSLAKIIFFNIIENAAKYTGKGSVTFNADFTDDKTVISVTDTGCGIETDKIPHLSELYFRANREIPGTGIGLYLVNNICKILDAETEIISQPQKGCKFNIFFKNN
ncbi:MAG: HAMP domain-containing histidine kinase [Armatimonadetes bacterium]|nr:HAMP domain-containing histidine kinase [Candidatus Hippobium faecium]